MRAWRKAGLALATTVLTVTGTVTTQAQAAPRPHIGDAVAYGAPTGKKGGVKNPVGWCSNYRVDPRVRWTLRNPDTGYSRTFRWRGVLPGIAFPRVEVGTYTSRTVARCRDRKKVRTQAVTVKQKTARTTISRTEFRRIHRGMTPDRVRDIVGYRGVAAGHYAGKRLRNYDMMRFWRWTSDHLPRRPGARQVLERRPRLTGTSRPGSAADHSVRTRGPGCALPSGSQPSSKPTTQPLASISECEYDRSPRWLTSIE